MPNVIPMKPVRATTSDVAFPESSTAEVHMLQTANHAQVARYIRSAIFAMEIIADRWNLDANEACPAARAWRAIHRPLALSQALLLMTGVDMAYGGRLPALTAAKRREFAKFTDYDLAVSIETWVKKAARDLRLLAEDDELLASVAPMVCSLSRDDYAQLSEACATRGYIERRKRK